MGRLHILPGRILLAGVARGYQAISRSYSTATPIPRVRTVAQVHWATPLRTLHSTATLAFPTRPPRDQQVKYEPLPMPWWIRILNSFQLRQVKSTVPSFDEAAFLEGAKRVFVDIHEIVRKPTEESLSSISEALTPELLEVFRASIGENDQESVEFNGIKSATIARCAANMKPDGVYQSLMVEFITEESRSVDVGDGQGVYREHGEYGHVWRFESPIITLANGSASAVPAMSWKLAI